MWKAVAKPSLLCEHSFPMSAQGNRCQLACRRTGMLWERCRGSTGCCGQPEREVRRELERKRAFPHPTLIRGACLSLAALRDLGVDPCRCYLRLLAAASGMGDVCVPHLLPHLPAAPLKLPPRLPQEQRELESAGKEGMEHGQMLAAAAV